MRKKHEEIQEIAKILLDVGKSYYGLECDQIEAMCEATALYESGYRKQSEGEWMWTVNGEADFDKYWRCSACGRHDYFRTKYCPDCGAKMKGGAE